MRSAAWLLSLLLLLAPFGLAQDGSQSGSTSPAPAPAPCEEGNATAQEECRAARRAHCRENPRDPGCRPAGNSTDDGEGCRDDGGDEDDEAERCERAVRKIRETHGRDWISFEVDEANATLLDYTIVGLLALEELRLDLDDGNLSIERQGSALHVRDGSSELRLHDEPNGLIRFKGVGNVTLVLPADATVERDEVGARIVYAGGRTGHLLADNATWVDDVTVQLNGFFAFHVPPRGAPAAADRPADPAVEDGKLDAIERRTLGAEITLRPRGPEALRTAEDDSIEVLAYDDVEVEVDHASLDDPEVPIRVVVSSELEEGRTIVLNLDEGLLSSNDPADLELRYYDLHNQTDGTVLETEVVFYAASSLQDVLEPMDDGGQPEFWVVEDANGVQVLVSVPHWSSHAITVASISSALHAPSVAVGIVAGIAASTALAALLMWPRRRDDEL